jgi:hypothetical protein
MLNATPTDSGRPQLTPAERRVTRNLGASNDAGASAN